MSEIQSISQEQKEVKEEEKGEVPLFVKIDQNDAVLLEKMIPLLFHYGFIRAATKKEAIAYCIRLTAVMLSKYIEGEEGGRGR